MTATITNCRFCGMSHGIRCPSIKAIEYHEDGTVRRVEFMTAADYYAPLSAPISPPYTITTHPGWPHIGNTYGPTYGPYDSGSGTKTRLD